MEYKYTPDGKKVVVIGALNSKETIVQEIYVVDGSEIPAGEHFIARSLLDAPAETYQSKEEKRLIESIERKKAELSKLEKEVAQFNEKCVKAMETKLKWINGITEEEVKNVFDMIVEYITGKYTHVVYEENCRYVIQEWSPELFTTSDNDSYRNINRFESVRLVSIFGHWNDRKKQDWRVNKYSDGSGYNVTFIPCKSYEAAQEVLKGLIYAKPELNNYDYEACLKYGIPVENDKNSARIKKHNDNLLSCITNAEKQLERFKSEMISEV